MAEQDPTTTAFQMSTDDGCKHVVGIGDLRVLISEESGAWIAQGLEIDYFAEGESIEAAQEAFQTGLMATIREHLKLYGDIDKLLRVAPQEEWNGLMKATPHVHSQVSFHELPYQGINYLRAA